MRRWQEAKDAVKISLRDKQKRTVARQRRAADKRAKKQTAWIRGSYFCKGNPFRKEQNPFTYDLKYRALKDKVLVLTRLQLADKVAGESLQSHSLLLGNREKIDEIFLKQYTGSLKGG